MLDDLGAQVDARALRVFRALFGCLLTVMPIRFTAYGWIETLYLEPRFHFAWVPWAVVPSGPVLYGMHAALALAGLCVATGRFVRPALLLYLALFGYLELLDKVLYLNHYVLVTLLLGTLALLPSCTAERTPRWTLRLLQLEFGLVWFWAGVCKLNSDWMLRGEPLYTWLHARMELPVVGPLLARWETALAMSWGGALFDLFIFPLLLWRRTRVLALLLLVGFHVVTGLLFSIGVFPWVMLLGALLFVEPERFGGGAVLSVIPGRMRPHQLAWAGILIAVLLLFPARHWLYPGWVNWNEQGFRFAWRVLLIEKSGVVDYRVVEPATGRSWTVDPRSELTELQSVQMRTQPDLILDYAHHLVRRNREAGREVQVFAHSIASLNGRRRQTLVCGDVDLARVSAWDTGWIEPLHDGE